MLDPRIILLQGLLMEHNLIITSITVYITLLRIQFYSNPKPHKRSHRKSTPKGAKIFEKKNAFCQKIFEIFQNFYNKVENGDFSKNS